MSEPDAPNRLIDILRARGMSSRAARDALASGKVSIDGMPTADGGRDVDGAEVVVNPSAPRLAPGRDLVLLRRDEHLAVVYKPAGMLAVPARGRGATRNVLAEAGRLLGTVYAVHRLDEPTSGLMMVARTEATRDALKALLEVHAVDRRYLALVAGRFPTGVQTFDDPLVRDRGDGLRGVAAADVEGARRALTRVRGRQALRGATLVEARLETGRTHQVRIHLSSHGYPVLGDPLYATRAVAGRAPRLALHATALGFVHPQTGERWWTRIPLADDLERLRRDLAGRPSRRR